MTILRHNSASIINFNQNFKRPHPPSYTRSVTATPRTVKNQKKLRRNALASIKRTYQTVKNMTNEQFNKVINNLKIIKKYKNLGTISINNISYLIAAQNNALRRRQVWTNVKQRKNI